MNESKHIPTYPDALEEYLGDIASAEVLHILEVVANYNRHVSSINEIRELASTHSRWCVSAETVSGKFVGLMLVPVEPQE